MFTNKKAKYNGDNNVLIDAACLSTDTKPTTGIANGSKCIEMDTGKTFMFNEEDSEWEELPSSGGGGGGSSDIPTAEVVFTDTKDSVGSCPFYGYHEDETYNYVLTAFAKVGETHYSYYNLPHNSSKTFTLYLVGGYGIIDTGENNVAVTGNAEVVYDSVIGEDVVKITGDCTITIS